MRDLLLVTHIVAVAVWLGASVTQMMVAPMLTRQEPAVAAAWMSASMNLSKRLYPVAGVLVLLAGIGLVIDSEVYEFSDAFVAVGFVVIVLAGVLGGRVFGPTAEKAAEAYRTGDITTARASSTKIARFGLLDIVLIVVAIVAMVMRWGA